jgi:outer membrane immunogenic protein
VKRIFLASLLAATLIGSAAQAAGPVSPPAPAVFNWSGLYAGLHAGYGWGDTVHANNIGVSTGDFGVSGGLAGVQLGYNWQSGQWVYGFEADVAWTGIDGSIVSVCTPATCKTDVDWLATIRGRSGFIWDRYLMYATAGVAFADVNGTIDGGAVGVFGSSRTRTGWTAGAGIEGAFGSRWTAKLEYLYVDLGDANFYSFFVGGVGTVVGNVDTRLHLLRVGLNYKF